MKTDSVSSYIGNAMICRQILAAIQMRFFRDLAVACNLNAEAALIGRGWEHWQN